MDEETTQITNEPWKCTGGLEYGGFHPEVINYQDQCQFCNRHRNELVPVNNKKKTIIKEKNNNSEKISLIKKYILPQINRYKYGVIALIASALGLNNETVKTQIENLIHQYLKPSPQVTSIPTNSPTSVITPTTEITPPETVIETEKPPQEIQEEMIKPPMIVTILPENKAVEIKAGSSQVVEDNIALSPEMKSKNYNVKVNETTIFNFKLNPVTKEGEVSLAILQSQKTLHNSQTGELKEIVLDPGDYLIKISLIGETSNPYQLTISQK